jgi:GMP synthase-like glutamine amidotransferase
MSTVATQDRIKIAILDLYEGAPNEGMRCIRQIIEEFEVDYQISVQYDVFDVRLKSEAPDLSYDIYISTGGPGSPIDSEGSYWEKKYFSWFNSLLHYNSLHKYQRKHVLLICHSFQIFCRYYRYAVVAKRKSTSFGVMPIHKTSEGHHDLLLRSLGDPFWAVDSRDYQIIQPDDQKIAAEGGSILCLEKERPHVELERAVMAIRFNDAIVGLQFHPEADAPGMRTYLLREDKKQLVIEKHGEKKYWSMLDHLTDPDKILRTYSTIIPRFLMVGLNRQLNVLAHDQ